MKSAGPCFADGERVAQALATWQLGPPGEELLNAERDCLERHAGKLFGLHLLQIGQLGADLLPLADCPVRAKHLITEPGGTPLGVGLHADPRHLPIASDSVDAVILPHTLDFSSDPHQVLRETERVLIAQGRLLIFAFNPLSLWGLWRLALRRRGRVPWCANFHPYPRLHDWLSLLGFDIEATEVLMFRPPVASRALLARLQPMETVGTKIWPMMAGVYFIQAVKRVSTVTPIGPRWRWLGKPAVGAMEPTARVTTRLRERHD